MGDRSKSAERLKTPAGNKSAATPKKLPSVRPPTRAGGNGGAASQKSHAGPAGNSNPNYTEREQEKLMSKWRINVSRSRLCESAKCSFGGWRCPECVKEIVFGHCLLFEEMEGKVKLIPCLLRDLLIVTYLQREQQVREVLQADNSVRVLLAESDVRDKKINELAAKLHSAEQQQKAAMQTV